jgi:hypothetical protein
MILIFGDFLFMRWDPWSHGAPLFQRKYFETSPLVLDATCRK